MKAGDLSHAYRVSQELAELKRLRDIVAGGAGLGITIQSSYQDEAFIEAIRPYAVGELDRRMQEKKTELVDLGVSFPDA